MFSFFSAFRLVFHVWLLRLPSTVIMLTVPNFVILHLVQCPSMCANMSTTCILDTWRILARVWLCWIFLAEITSLESPLTVPGSSNCCNAEVMVCPSHVVLVPSLICSYFAATWKLSAIGRCRIWLDHIWALRSESISHCCGTSLSFPPILPDWLAWLLVAPLCVWMFLAYASSSINDVFA